MKDLIVKQFEPMGYLAHGIPNRVTCEFVVTIYLHGHYETRHPVQIDVGEIVEITKGRLSTSALFSKNWGAIHGDQQWLENCMMDLLLRETYEAEDEEDAGRLEAVRAMAESGYVVRCLLVDRFACKEFCRDECDCTGFHAPTWVQIAAPSDEGPFDPSEDEVRFQTALQQLKQSEPS